MQWIVIAIFIFLRIIFSISKAANEKGQKQKQRVQANPGRQQRVQSEIEAFLSEVSGNKQPRKSERSEAELAEQRQRQLKRKAEAKRRQYEEQQKQKTQQRRRLEPQASTSKSRHVGERKVGSGVAAHVDQYIGQHVTEHINHDVDEYVDATIVDSVEEHLGSRNLEMPSTTVGSQESSLAAASIAKMLRSPEGVRNAIIINEILARPRPLRR